MAYAFALHLNGDVDETLSIINSINNILKNTPLVGVEKSEVIQEVLFTSFHFFLQLVQIISCISLCWQWWLFNVIEDLRIKWGRHPWQNSFPWNESQCSKETWKKWFGCYWSRVRKETSLVLSNNHEFNRKLIELNPYNKGFYNLLKEVKGLPSVPSNEEERLQIVNFFDETSAKYKVRNKEISEINQQQFIFFIE